MFLLAECCFLLLIVASNLADSSPPTSTNNSSVVMDVAQDQLEVTVTRTSRPIRKSAGVGGQEGGEAFDDWLLLNGSKACITGISSINISYGDQINSIQVTYLLSNGSLLLGPLHGKISKPPITIELGANEYVSKIRGNTNGVLADQLTIVTTGATGYEHKVYGPFGKTGEKSFSFQGYILAFHGRSGDLINNIGVYRLPRAWKSKEFGTHTDDKYTGRPFDDKINLGVPPIVGISKLHIWHDSLIPAIQIEYLLLGGSTRLGDMHGTEYAAGNLTTITLEEGERLVQLRGKTGDFFFDYINQLSFTTIKKGGVYVRYGPFGKLGNVNFRSRWKKICGFFGSSGPYVFGLGVYYM